MAEAHKVHNGTLDESVQNISISFRGSRKRFFSNEDVPISAQLPHTEGDRAPGNQFIEPIVHVDSTRLVTDLEAAGYILDDVQESEGRNPGGKTSYSITFLFSKQKIADTDRQKFLDEVVLPEFKNQLTQCRARLFAWNNPNYHGNKQIPDERSIQIIFGPPSPVNMTGGQIRGEIGINTDGENPEIAFTLTADWERKTAQRAKTNEALAA